MVMTLAEKRAPSFDELEALIRNYKPGLITLSPLNRFVSQYVKSINDDQLLEPVLDKLHLLGESNNCLINGIKHINKKPDLTAAERVGGGGAFTNSARCGFISI
jgi:hypothetical protein